MSFFDTIVLDIILTLFPIICVLIIKANLINKSKISTKVLIDIANFTSLFLLIKYCDKNNAYMILLVNMPFVISILHNRKIASIIILIALIIFNAYLGINLSFIIGEYIVYLITFIILNKKKVSINSVLLSFISIKGFFLTIYEYYILSNSNFLTIIKVFVSLTIFYLIGLLIINIINMVNNTMNLNQSLKQLEKEKELKNGLFKITHETKNPIAVCKGYLQMMEYSDLNKVKKYNTIIESELNRALDIMDNFSEYTKIKINPDIMDLDYLLTETIKSMSSIFKHKNIDVNYENIDEVFINGDYERLKQVFINILKNSSEAISNKGFIGITLKTNKKYAIVEIKDNGCGMSEEELKKMSQLFYSSKEKGCGIGVALSKEIISLHRGSLRYKSVVGEYTKAIIKLPL
ncbi:MAG: HAMP domain-containing histidine kinase [Bacilli bacterium]|nr:HAMP domain-containing histidine kinase [Bacilli bacterium]